MKYKFLLLTSLLVLIFSSCKNIEQTPSLTETTTVTFAAETARSIYTTHSNTEYTYTIKGKAKSGATFQTDRNYTYNELSYTRFEIQKGTWDFTMNAFTGEELIFTGTKSVTIDKSSVINIPVYAKTGSTASLSVKLNFPQDKGVAKITAALYDSVTEADAGSALTLEAGYVTYKNNDVPAGTNKTLKFYLYDCQDVCIASYIEGVYLAAQDNVSVERTLSNVNTFAATVCVKDVNGNDVIDSGLLVKAVKVDKEYPMTAVSGTNMYTASLPVGTYDVYSGQTDSGTDLVVEFQQGGTTSFIYYCLEYTATRENYSSVVASLTQYSTIVLTGELSDSDLASIATAIENSSYKVNLDLSLTTGLTSIPDSTFRDCLKLSGITIPDSVTSIGRYAFYGCKSLSSVNIPDTVTYIRDYAFYDCTSLSSVTIPDSVTYIAGSTFYNCTSLSSVTIPYSVTYIYNYAFYGCTSLSSVTFNCPITFDITQGFEHRFDSNSVNIVNSVNIGVSVTSIDSGAFYVFKSLTDISVDSNNAYYSSIDGVLFNKDASTLIRYPAGKQSATYTIPDSVTSIDSEAFYQCSSLSSVTIPDSVTSIGSSTFPGCTSLSSVTIPDSVTSIGSSTFYNCTSLSSVTIPDSVTSIGVDAFHGCTSLSSVTIPDSVTSIASRAFAVCTSLATITVDSNNANYSSIDGVMFNKDATAIISYPAGKQSAAYIIPDSVTSIGSYAFYSCTSLSSVTIPDSVTSICDYAFMDCSKLTSISFIDTTTWYRTNSSTNWNQKTGGTLTDVNDAAANVTYFKNTYKYYYWYKLDE